MDWNNDECSSPNCVNDHYQWLDFRDRGIPTCDESKLTPREGEQVLRFSERQFAIPSSGNVLLSLMEGSRHQNDGLGDPTEGVSDFCSPPSSVKIIRNSGLLFCTSIKPSDDGKRAQLRLQMRDAKPKYDAETPIEDTSKFANLLGEAVADYLSSPFPDGSQSGPITVIHGPVKYSKSCETAEFHGRYEKFAPFFKYPCHAGQQEYRFVINIAP